MMNARVCAAVAVVCFFSVAAGRVSALQRRGCNSASFSVIETMISGTHEAIRSGRVTCKQIVEIYQKRIATFDQSTRLNTVVVLNPTALADADELDRRFAATHTLAFSPVVSESSIAGITRNPYDLNRVPAGSSGGTAAAVAANLAEVGLGSDTGDSIRGPSSHNDLVGIRPTIGLTSRDGIIPLNSRADVGGPLARTVEDAARVLTAVAGYDPADPVTERSKGKIPPDYTAFLDKSGLRGARLGVFRHYIHTPTTDDEIKGLMEKATAAMRALGAEMLDFTIPNFDDISKGVSCGDMQADLNRSFAVHVTNAPYHSLQDIYDSGLYLPSIQERLKRSLDPKSNPNYRPGPCLDTYNDARKIAYREAIVAAMEAAKLDAVIYPTWSDPPRLVGDMKSPAGDNSQQLAPATGMPAITVPMGFTHRSLPAGLSILGRAFSEPMLFKYAYAYEQATSHRRPPAGFGDDEPCHDSSGAKSNGHARAWASSRMPLTSDVRKVEPRYAVGGGE